MKRRRTYEPISAAEYLRDEAIASWKREFVDGRVYLRPDERNLHNLIVGNIVVAVHRLRGRRCRPFNSDTKIRVRLPSHVRFYYPDVSIVCHQNSPDESFQDNPAVIVEVLSRATRRTDEGEKKDAYLAIPALAIYLLVEQESATFVAFRRTEQGFVREVYEGRSAVIPLCEIEADLPLSEIYEGVEFSPERPVEEESLVVPR